MKTFLFFLLLPIFGYSQTIIKGKVTDKKGQLLIGANIQIVGTYDGASANEKGEYQFQTDEKGEKQLPFR